ncbi:hypothetical protein K457DRAFT_152907 [Linnemannia elongata AG-77]|uniref:RING-type E3 ubiquitin transferase n=1 Tax=Linnemannia elongata AG-77 TaxID=1314771 RepID=A0A197K9H9_9FUNG|nr:hypothetical protein K457DRAFT_152907 [Linnemannia elongata AG-77]
MDRNEAPSNNANSSSNNQPPADNANTATHPSGPSSTLQPPSITSPPPPSAKSTTTTTVPTSTTAAAQEAAPPSTATVTTQPTTSSTTSSVPVTTSTAPTTTTTTTLPNPTPEPPAPATTPAAPAAPTTTTSAPAPSNDPPEIAAAASGRRDEYWCHQCQAEITPMMVPDPMCPTCYSEFVEKIEADNDPRAFAPHAPAVPSHRTGGSYQYEDERYPEVEGRNHQGPVNLEDLFQLFQAFYTPHRSEAHQQLQRQQQQEMYQQQQQRNQNQQQRQQHIPGQFFTTGTQYIFTSGPSGTTQTVTPLGSSGPTPAHGSQQSTGGHTLGGDPSGAAPTTEEGAAGEGQHLPLGPQWHSPPSLISSLLSRLGIEIHYTTDPSALSGGFGGPMGFGGGFLPMAGNPGDYAWGQRGLDDIITQMMELQNRQHGPVGATDEIINAIPHHTLTDEELEAKTECSVCKDEFAKEDNLLQLPCKHIFHEDCIKPWLKVSGTCPTCRFSLVGGQDSQHTGDHTSPPHGGQDNNSSSGNNAPPGGNSDSSTGARPGSGGVGGFFGFGSAPPSSTGTNTPGSFPSSNNNINNNATIVSGGGGDEQTQSGGTQNTNHNLPIEPLD